MGCKKLNKIAVILFGCIFFLSEGIAQVQLGQTEVRTFTRNQYAAGAQNWAMAQDENKRLYIANNEGLLIFDGKNWQLFPVPNKTILRSISFAPDGKLFAGAQDEFGYYEPDEVGRLHYVSLKSLLPANEKKFTDVWQLEVCGKDVFFRTSKTIFRFRDQKVVALPAQSNWLSLHQHQYKALAQDESSGLLQWSGNQWETLIRKENLPNDFLITDLIRIGGDTSLLCTEKRGLFYLIRNELVPFPVSSKTGKTTQHFTSLTQLKDKSLLAGTYFNGVFHLSSAGEVLENISGKNGLRNSTVRCVQTDNTDNVWMGLDNGIAFFEYQNPIMHINPPAFNNGVGYDVKRFENNLYFALSTGLQWLPIPQNIQGQQIPTAPQSILPGLTWNISVLNDRIVAGRDDGLWSVRNNRASQIAGNTGFWAFKPFNGTPSTGYAAGNYFGIQLFEKNNGDITNLGPIPGFNESSRYLETLGSSIWVSHPYRGVYRLSASNGFELYNQKNGLPADLNNHVFKVKGKILIATTKGIYEYDSLRNQMIKSADYQSIFSNIPIRYLKEDLKGNIWFVQDKMVGVADFSGPKPTIHYIPELKNKIVSGFENIFPFNEKDVFVGSDEGFYYIQYEKYREKIKPFSVYLTQVKTIVSDDSVLFGGFRFGKTNQAQENSLPYRLNSLHFAFAASIFNQPSNLEFSYKLEGFDLGWSKWSPNSEKDYTNLPAGSYTFYVKARNSPSHGSFVSSYSFSVRPPFYQTYWAYAFYVLAFGTFLYNVLSYQSRRHRKKLEARRLADQKQYESDQKQIAYLHQLELEKSEKEFIRLQNEKLEGEIEHKNAELASATMNLVQKKEFILKLKTELQQLQKASKVGDDNPELKKLLKTLAEEEKLNKEWEHFSQHFNSVHGDFLTILKHKFPLLKPHELKLCAYLRMNLSSKEIAQLMSISVRGVEIGRYRLRKKLNLTTEENLTQFLLDMSEKNEKKNT